MPPTPTRPPHYAELCGLLKEAATLGSIGSLLGWDQETYMPPAAAGHRAQQQALVAGLVHERQSSPRVGELLQACEADPALRQDPAAAANLREMRRDYDRATKVPTDLVAELARTGSLAQEAWKDARARNDFPAFAPWLTKMMTLSRRKADCLAPGSPEPYDALLDEYEPGMTAKEIAAVFAPLRDRLAQLIGRVRASGRTPDQSVLKIRTDPQQQHRFGELVLKAMGFDLSAGRLDVTTHPFCSGMAPGDTRLTTRYTGEGFLEPLYGTMHEGGHGLYEQGLPKADHFGEPLGEAISLGIHESQSRMWENFVGRGRAFWEWALPEARRLLGPALEPVTVDAVYAAANTVRPSFIRVESDESTYNLHIMLRFEIERALISGDLRADDLPGVWNERFESYLGLKVPDDRRGCLQDVHWSFGLVGYFPTYTLGNLYAAQLWEMINRQLPGLESDIRRGELIPLRDWLRANIHAHGKRYRAAELCQRVTGRPLSSDPLLRHLESRLAPVYGL
ncbi:MAG TPA: carboxypeptidase M32 [Phycisphaerales bacterium]|nr:carboxypeptidase M32 [Phycisphaerales bacterium]